MHFRTPGEENVANDIKLTDVDDDFNNNEDEILVQDVDLNEDEGTEDTAEDNADDNAEADEEEFEEFESMLESMRNVLSCTGDSNVP